MIKKSPFLLIFPFASLCATDYSFVDRMDMTVDKKNPWFVEADYARVGSANFTTSSVKPSSLKYGEGALSLYYSHFLNPANALSWQLGYANIDLNWKKNPRFRQREFHFAALSLAWISTALDRWRWVLNLGGTVDAARFDVARSGVIYGLVWGRYQVSNTTGIHIGMFGFGGIHSGYALPVFGIDYSWSKKWTLNVIFPLDFSLRYACTRCFSAALSYSTFGGPYRYPKRAHQGIGSGFEDPVFQVYSRGVEAILKYALENSRFSFEVGGGWNFGGWILIQNTKGRHGRYYKFDSAPYGSASLCSSF